MVRSSARALAALSLVLAAAGAAQPPQRVVKARARLVRPPSPPERYRLALARTRTCADFARLVGRLPDAKPLLRTLFVNGIPEQTETETQDGFVNRIVRRLFLRLGDPSRVHTSSTIGDAARYDAATRTMTVTLAGDPYSALLDRAARTPTTTAPREITELRAILEFPPGALPAGLTLPMDAREAARFQRTARLHVLSLLEDYGTDVARQPPDAAAPTGVTTTYHLVRMTPHCAVITDGGAVVKGWRFDHWVPESAGR